MPLVLAMLLLVGGMLLTHIWVAGAHERSMSDADRRMLRMVKSSGLADDLELSKQVLSDQPVKSGVVRALSKWIESRGQRWDIIATLDRWLANAGRPRGLSASDALAYAAVYWASTAVLIMLATERAGINRVLGALMMLVLMAYPVIKLFSIIKSRRERVQLELLSVVNDLKTSISSNLTLEEAFGRVIQDDEYEDEQRVLVAEFGIAYRAWRIGNQRMPDALRDAANRMGVREIDAFVDAIANGIRNGTRMDDVLSRQYETVKQKHTEMQQRRIDGLQTKFLACSVPTFLAMMVLVLGPTALRVGDAFGG